MVDFAVVGVAARVVVCSGYVSIGLASSSSGLCVVEDIVVDFVVVEVDVVEVDVVDFDVVDIVSSVVL